MRITIMVIAASLVLTALSVVGSARPPRLTAGAPRRLRVRLAKR